MAEDLEERARRGETRDFYRVPSKGVTVGSKRIAQAVDDEEWQRFRHSLKGTTTVHKLRKLEEYFCNFEHGHDAMGQAFFKSQGKDCLDGNCDVCIRVDNYIKALCRGGQLYAGESLHSAIMSDWKLEIKK